MFPINLKLSGRPCLVVGGGKTAFRKIAGLLSEGAVVTVTAPDVTSNIENLLSQGNITLNRRKYILQEVTGYSLAFAATNDRKVNQQVYEDAVNADVWINTADDPELCTFHLPAKIKRGSFQLTVSTDGKSPFVSKRMRKLLERKFDEKWSRWAKTAAAFRKNVKEKRLEREQEEILFNRFFDATVNKETLEVKILSAEEEIAVLSESKINEQRVLNTNINHNKKTGLVSLVGAGPGDPGLLTVKGKESLFRADAIVCDRLAVPVLPCDLPSNVEIYFVGKEAQNHPVPQDEINALLIKLAKENKHVVRLKGGDPYIFGRGGEEAIELVHANIPFELIPGVTAASAVAAYAGIPLTYRKEVVRVTLVTAHEATKQSGPQVRWDLLAADTGAVIIGYMGVTNLPNIIEELLKGGLAPDTPAALVERGTTSMQRKVISTVHNLVRDVKTTALAPPALFIIGSSVRHAELLDWFGKRPLLGQETHKF